VWKDFFGEGYGEGGGENALGGLEFVDSLTGVNGIYGIFVRFMW
jgi:hypothetical protein